MTSIPDHRSIITTLIDSWKDALDQINPAELEGFESLLRQSRRVFITGAGRSGLVVKACANRLMHLGLTVHIVGEVTTPAIGEGDVLVVASNSGTTPGPVHSATVAATVGARVVALTSTPDSPLAALADCVITIPSVSTQIPLPLGTFFEQNLFIVLESCIVHLQRRFDFPESALKDRHANME